ncbi:hypothetical protein PV797_09045 [Clostridiaceae bacterium M8S5]|nr:hypothetical protein PV797_09045 [Clostridiaceae bacterium M8S5]
MANVLQIAKCLCKTSRTSYKNMLKSYLKQIIVLFFFILISIVFNIRIDKKTIYLLGIVGGVANCANFGQIILNRKNCGIYENILGEGHCYNQIVLVEFLTFLIMTFPSILFMILSNCLFWFVINGKISILFILVYGALICITSILFALLAIQSSISNDNAPYLMSFSIFGIIIILMLWHLKYALMLIYCIVLILNALLVIKHTKSLEWLYKKN